MADTLVDGAAGWDLEVLTGLWGPYWSDESVGIIVFVDSGSDLSFARTTNKGASWTKTEIVAGTVPQLACWYDKETPGRSGALIHMAWLDAAANTAYYQTVDVSDGSLGTRRAVDSTLTVPAQPASSRIAITVTVNGNIIIAFSTQSEIECYKSSDNFASAGTDIADVYETATQEDWVLLFPADVDAGDACALFLDRSAFALSVKMYDDSANTWNETNIAAQTGIASSLRAWDGAVRLSDKHILVADHSSHDTAGDDLRTWDLTVDSIASPTVTAKTNIFTDQAESAMASVFINQQNDDVYVAYLKGGTWMATVDAVYHVSTDGMAGWGAEQAYSEAAAGDIRLVPAGRTVGNDGGRYQPSFFNDDAQDIYINETNDIEIAPPPDVAVDTSTQPNLNYFLQRAGPVWTDENTGYIFYQTNLHDLVYRKTINGGASWGAETAIPSPAAGTVSQIDIWFDKWTPGDTGTLIHIWWMDTEVAVHDVFYRTLNTSDDSLGTQRTVFNGSTFGRATRTAQMIGGTKAVGGNLYVQFWGDASGENGFYRSIDAGATWTSRTDGADGSAVDTVFLLPDDDSADNEDVIMLYWDVSANEISIKKYDNSDNSWAETLVASGHAESSSIQQWSAAVRHSDGHIILAAWTAIDTATSDLKVYDITLTTPSIATKTDVVTDADDCTNAALFIDQNTDDIYVAYFGQEDGAQTWLDALDVHYKKSDDGGDTWGAETTYSVDTADDLRYIDAGHSTPGAAAGRFEPFFYNDDLKDIFVNKDNSVEITVAVAVDDEEFAGTLAERSDPSTYKLKQEVVGY